MKSMRMLAMVSSMVVLSFFLMNIPAQATIWYESTNYPVALYVSSGEPRYLTEIPNEENAKAYLYSHATVIIGEPYETMQWVKTGIFIGGNATELPDDNATIIWAYVISVWPSTISPESVMGFSINGGSTWQWSNTFAQQSSGTEKILIWNVTTLASWTPQIMKSTSLYVKIYCYTDAGVYSELDYLGWSYIWSSPVQPPSQGGDEGGSGGTGIETTMTLPDVLGLMGITGFIGMIGIPAASIWFFRHDGGSKIHAGVMALIGFTVCFGFFLASINGG